MTVEKNNTSIQVLKVKVENIVYAMRNFVTEDRFKPIEKIVWTLVILVLTGVVGGLLSLIIK